MRDQGIDSGVKPTLGGEAEGRLDQQFADDRLTWTVPEAARLLGISKDCAYDAARRGDLPVRLIGRRVVVPRTALLRLLDEARALDRQHPPPG